MAGEDSTFIDTNVLIYAHDRSEAAKQPIATALLASLWESGTGVLSTQVLQEFYAVATRKLTPPMTPAEAREIVGLYAAWRVVTIEPPLILEASELAEAHELSFWDALIIAAARLGGADRLVTEDLQAGRMLAGVRIENPFGAAGETG